MTVEIPDGSAGIAETLKIMARLAKDAAHSGEIRQLAQRLTNPFPSKDWRAELRAIHAFVRDRIRYVKDPAGTELVQTPRATLQLGSGDCDDKCVLAAALLKSINHPVRYCAVAFKPGEFSHVFIESKIGPRWIPCELTESWITGVEPPRIVGRMRKDV